MTKQNNFLILPGLVVPLCNVISIQQGIVKDFFGKPEKFLIIFLLLGNERISFETENKDEWDIAWERIIKALKE